MSWNTEYDRMNAWGQSTLPVADRWQAWALEASMISICRMERIADLGWPWVKHGLQAVLFDQDTPVYDFEN